jgi:hypothetical protein
MTRTYDSKCYELAEHFLAEEPNLDDEGYRRALTHLIQYTIENFMKGALDEQETDRLREDSDE